MERDDQFWNIDTNAGQLLQALVFTHQPKEILEIGTSNGYSAILMAEIAQQYGGHVTSIEFHEKRIILAKENLEKAGLSNSVTILQGDALEVLRTLPLLTKEGVGEVSRDDVDETPSNSPLVRGREHGFNFFFIDANKKQYGEYFTECMRLAHPGAIIVADNTISHRHSLDSFFDELKKAKNIDILESKIGTGLVIVIIR